MSSTGQCHSQLTNPTQEQALRVFLGKVAHFAMFLVLTNFNLLNQS